MQGSKVKVVQICTLLSLFEPEEITITKPNKYEAKNTLLNRLQQTYETNSAG